MSTRNLRGVIAHLKQYGEDAKARAKVVVLDSLERTHATSSSLCPYDRDERDDFHMVEHLRGELTKKGFGYEVGFEESDFTAAGLDFYPVYVIFGTRYMPAKDFLFAPNEAEKARFKQALAEALRPRRRPTRRAA